VAVATGAVQAAGASADGDRILYVEGAEGSGDLYSFAPASGERIQINASDDARVVNVAPDGSRVYFESPSVLNSDGTVAAGSAGPPRLYVWDGSSVAFITTVSEADLGRASGFGYLGLAQWVGSEAPARNGGFLLETSRTNWNGTSFAFESDADIGGDNPGGMLEIYRYQTETGSIECVSCVEGLAVGDAAFADYSFPGFDTSTVIPNLSEDGSTVFFQTAAPLLPRDSNGEMDVYEWHEGDLALISTGQDSGPSLLMGATPSGNDVFIRTAGRLVPQGQEPGMPAIYDARVGGGFNPPGESPFCSLESCQIDPPAEAASPPPASALFVGPRNRRKHRSKSRRRCHRRHAHRHRRCVKVRHTGPSKGGR
jgi:hypothetical protein